MKFKVIESLYNEQGTRKAFCVHDDWGNLYWLPRSQIKVVEKLEKRDALDVTGLVIDIPGWIIRNKQIPIFRITELNLVR